MAEAVFDEHPLGEYFRESGEIQEVMPGSHPEYSAEPSTDGTQQQHAAGSFILRILERSQVLGNLLFPHPSPNSTTAFAERFKYDVISSSLLSASLAASPQPGRRSFVSELPGRLQSTSAGDHSRTSSTSVDHNDDVFGQKHIGSTNDTGDLRAVVAIISVAVLAFSAGYELLSMLFVAIALFVARAAKPEVSESNAPALTLDALNELISAGNVWDSAVNEAMSLIEKEERNPSAFYSPSSTQSPLLSLRVAMHTSLTTTQSQCDNVRQLLTALTSPQQLSQLSEMYAPASPIKPSFPSLALGESLRPLSDPVANWRKRTISAPSASNKRATWNGSQVLPSGGIESLSVLRRQDKRRSMRTSLFLTPEGNLSAPPTPLPQKVLHDVQEDPSESESELPYASKDEDVFGIAALNLRRKRRSAALETFGTPPPSYTSQTHGHSAHNSLSSIPSPSRFTLLHTNRRPFSLSALSLALHGALSAKRYACAHLLALRFEEDADDEGYWEDVRSIMALLTSTFSDASGNLVTALDEVEKKRMKDERPSTESLAASSREGSLSPGDGKRRISFGRPVRSMAEMTSFAPLPSHLTRFAAHVDAISSALNDARDHLEQCVASIREDHLAETPPQSRPDGVLKDVSSVEDGEEAQNAALRAYDRLRKELGFAFRECERGRECLLSAISSSKPMVDEDEDASPTVPSLAPDTSSEASVGVDTGLPTTERASAPGIAVVEIEQMHPPLDDASEHLLLTTSSHHLPPPGVEQVYEADSSAARFTRERSKLSREERIKLAKAKRESGVVLGIGSGTESRASKEQWGPGGEVVQELKDVIWQVSEKRRKLSERSSLETIAASDPLLLEVAIVGD